MFSVSSMQEAEEAVTNNGREKCLTKSNRLLRDGLDLSWLCSGISRIGSSLRGFWKGSPLYFEVKEGTVYLIHWFLFAFSRIPWCRLRSETSLKCRHGSKWRVEVMNSGYLRKPKRASKNMASKAERRCGWRGWCECRLQTSLLWDEGSDDLELALDFEVLWEARLSLDG